MNDKNGESGMSEWKEFKLKDAPLEIIDGDRGKNYPPQSDIRENGYCLFLSTKNVRSDGFDFSECQYIPKKRDELLRKGKLQKNDIVLTTRGTVGNVGYYNDAVKFNNIRINSGMVIIRPNSRELQPDFNYYIFRKLQKDFHTFISGSAQPQLPIKDLNEMEIYLPPLPEQRAIASVLSSLDDKIDLLHRQNKTLEALAETLFRQWFVEEAETDEMMTLGEFAINIKENAKVENLNNYLHYVGLEHIEKKCIALSRWGTPIELESNKSVFRVGDILFGKLRAYFHKVVFTPIAGVCSTDILVIRPKKKEWFSFCLFCFFSKDVVEYSDLGSGGTRMPRTNWEILSNYKIPKPDIQDIEDFEKIIRPTTEKISANIMQIRTLEKLRDTLLPKLMSGEVRVEVLSEFLSQPDRFEKL